jgi:FtsZ-interacting cell division protein ZipA
MKKFNKKRYQKLLRLIAMILSIIIIVFLIFEHLKKTRENFKEGESSDESSSDENSSDESSSDESSDEDDSFIDHFSKCSRRKRRNFSPLHQVKPNRSRRAIIKRKRGF